MQGNQEYKICHYQQALTSYTEALKIQKKLVGEQHPDTAKSYNEMGLTYYMLGKYSSALEYFKKALDIRQSILKVDHPDIATSYNNVGSIYDAIGDSKSALKYLDKALKLQIVILGEYHQDTATSYNNIGSIYDALGNFNLSLEYYEKALNIRIKLFGKISKDTANSYNNIGFVYFKLGNYDLALEYYQKALKIKDIPGDHRISVAIYYNNLASVYSEICNYEKALQLIEKSLEIRISIFGMHHIETAIAYNNLGSTYWILDKYNQALCYAEKALTIQKRVLGESHLSTATSYDNIGMIKRDIGDYKESYVNLKKALEIRHSLLKSKHLTLAVSYNNLGLLSLDLHECKNALMYYAKTLDITKKSLGEEHSYTALAYNNLGAVYEKAAKYEKSLKFYKKALNIREKSNDINHPDTAVSYNNIGYVLWCLSDYDQALGYMGKALNIQKEKFGENHSDVALSYKNISLVFFSIGEYKKAYEKLFKSILIEKNRKKDIFSTMDNRKKILFLKNKSTDLTILFHRAHIYIVELKKEANNQKIKEIKKQIYTRHLQEKGSYQDEETFLGIIYANTKDQNLKDKIKELKRLKYQYAKLLNEMTGDESEKQRINVLKEKISKLEQYLSEHIQRFKQEAEFDTITHKDIAKDLKADELFIDLAEGEKNNYFFTLNHKAKLEFVEISQDDTEKIQKNITEFRENIKERIESSNEYEISEIEKESTEILKALYGLIINKYLKEHIKEYKKLTISPDGRLNLLPFDALYDGKEYLLNTKEIYYISSGRELIRINRFGTSDKEEQDKIVVFADPDYDYEQDQEVSSSSDENEDSDDTADSRSNRAVTKFTNCKALPWTKEEANVIKQIFTEQSRVYVEKEANEEHFSETTDAHILHISTHGIVTQNDKEKEPLLKTALALTGYNTSVKQQKDYGVMTGLKIASMNLNNTELVVLSACETAIGESDNVIGVSSLSRAFMIAGAKSTIASLWEVEDKSTKEFFELFYHKIRIQTQTNYAKAFKETQREMYHKLKNTKNHSLYWAGFAFWGSV